MDHLDTWNDRRRHIASRYDQAFADLPDLMPVRIQPTVLPAFYQYVVATDQRDQLRRHLADQGVATAIHYPTLIPNQPSLRALGYSTDELPQAMALNRRILSLPVYAELTDDEITQVIAVVRGFFKD
jgi:dTDP-4-amino-4,6-dideoxygalactose transaminase